VLAGRQNPGLVLDSLSDGGAAGYTNSNRGGSIVWRKNGLGHWQILSDPNFDGSDILTINHLLSSRQMLQMFGTFGNMTYGTKASGFDSTQPDFSHNFRGSSFCFENSSGDMTSIWRLSDNSVRRITTFKVADDRIQMGNTANSAIIWGLDNLGLRQRAWGANVASAATIVPTGDSFHVTGVTTIGSITPPTYTGLTFKGEITIIPDGIFLLDSTAVGGNIGLSATTVVGKAMKLSFDGTKWYPSYTA
jgi:hypothetical protein